MALPKQVAGCGINHSCLQFPMAGKFESRKASPVCHDTRCSLVKKRLRKWKNAVYLIKIRFCLFCDSLPATVVDFYLVI